MPRELTPQQLEARRKARRLASDAGKNWQDLSKEERRPFLNQARSSAPTRSGAASARAETLARKAARAAAKKDGRNWGELSKEERRPYLIKALGT
jgi:hypothetical protein